MGMSDGVSDKASVDEEIGVDEAEARRDEDFDVDCGDADTGAQGFGGYGERGDDDARDYDVPLDDPWGIDGMGPEVDDEPDYDCPDMDGGNL